MPTWHPAALLRDETKKIDFIKDFKLVIEELNKQSVTLTRNNRYYKINKGYRKD